MTGANEREEAKVKCHERERGAGGVSCFLSSHVKHLFDPQAHKTYKSTVQESHDSMGGTQWLR